MIRAIVISLALLVSAPAFSASKDSDNEQHSTQSKSKSADKADKGDQKSFSCGSKTKCDQMTSCDEAKYYLTKCGVSSLDRDKDGTPCNSLCKKK